MAKKGLLEGILQDISKNVRMKSMIEASKNAEGKIDVAKASGMLMGSGFTSLEDRSHFGSLLGAEGAFDKDHDFDFSDDDLWDDKEDD